MNIVNEIKPVCSCCGYYKEGQCKYCHVCNYSLDWDPICEEWVPIETIYWEG